MKPYDLDQADREYREEQAADARMEARYDRAMRDLENAYGGDRDDDYEDHRDDQDF